VKTRPTLPLNAAQREALEARFALRLSARLDEGAQSVPHDITERLRVARQQAVEAARVARLKTAPAISVAPQGLQVGWASATAGAGRALGPWHDGAAARRSDHGRRLDDGPVSWGWRLASALPVLALVAGLWGVKFYHQLEQLEAAADVDIALLSDDLPPDAYADPGFAEFLSHDTAPATAVSALRTPDIEVAVQAPSADPMEQGTDDAAAAAAAVSP